MKYQKARYQENPEIEINYQQRRYQEIPELHKKYQKPRYLKCDEDENFLQQVKQGPYEFAQHVIEASIKAVSDYLTIKKYILTVELYHPVRLFHEKLCICEKCHKHLSKIKLHSGTYA